MNRGTRTASGLHVDQNFTYNASQHFTLASEKLDVIVYSS